MKGGVLESPDVASLPAPSPNKLLVMTRLTV